MEQIGLTIVYSTAELAIAVGVGALCDYVFPLAKEADANKPFASNNEAVMAALEAAAQVTVNALIGMGIVSLVVNASESTADPAAGMAFILGLQASQPSLWAKILRIVTHVRHLLSDIYSPINADAPATPAVKKQDITSPGGAGSDILRGMNYGLGVA